MMRWVSMLATASGSAGAAVGTATATAPLAGEIFAVHLAYGGTAATTDVTVATVHAPTTTLLTVTDNASDGWYYPRVQMHDVNGSALTLDGTQANVAPIPVCDQVRVTVTQADDGDTVTTTMVYAE